MAKLAERPRDEILHSIVEAGRRRDITVGIAYSEVGADAEDSVELGESRKAVFAASFAKLAVAAFGIANPERIDELRLVYLSNMLEKSDNTAFKDLAEHLGRRNINSFGRNDLGLRELHLTVSEEGHTISGYTCAVDALRLINFIMAQSDEGHVTDTARAALVESRSGYGVLPRRRIKHRIAQGIVVANKTGEYNGNNDPDVLQTVRHDAGTMVAEHGKQSLAYAITTAIPRIEGPFSMTRSRIRAKRSSGLIEAAGNELAGKVGGSIVGPFGAAVGHLGTR